MNEKDLEQTSLNPEDITLEDILADFDMDDGWTDEKDLSCEEPTIPLESISQVVVPEYVPAPDPAEEPQEVTEEAPEETPEVTEEPIPEEPVSEKSRNCAGSCPRHR